MPPFDAALDSSTDTKSAPSKGMARPVWFGESRAPLFGLFHPAIETPTDAVVVLCSPFGYDVGTAHHGYQRLAEALARRGVAALRFDYAHTGNSAGECEGPDRVEAWTASIEIAAAEARRQSGARHVILFGARSGALLATVAAQARPGLIDGLILLGPPRSGSAFVRELLAFNKMRIANPGDGASPDIQFSDDEILGYAFPSDLRAALSELDPRTVEEKPAPRALVIARDDIPGPEVKLVEHFRELGIDVDHSHAKGYAAVFDFKAIPAETVDEIVAWVEKVPKRELDLPQTSPPSPSPSRVSFADVTEETVTIDGMFGIVTEPPAQPGIALRETGILLAGTGANQHVGVSRLHVRLARDLAKLGFRVLRFDLSGIGESPVRPGLIERMFYTPQGVPETRTAIDWMIARGTKQVALAGLCSGGYTAFHAAVHNPRIVSIVSANVPGFLYNDVDAALLARDRPTLRSLLRTALVSHLSPNRGPKNALVVDEDDVARGFGTILTRGCAALVVYGSGDSGLRVFENHLGPGLAKARGAKNLALEVIPGSDHTFTPRVAQRRLHTLVTQMFASLR